MIYRSKRTVYRPKRNSDAAHPTAEEIQGGHKYVGFGQGSKPQMPTASPKKVIRKPTDTVFG